jgi:hypothetical protein
MQGGQLNTRAAATFSTATKTAAAQIQKHPALHQAAHNECWHHDEVPNTPDVPAATVFPQAGGGSICCLLEKQTHRPAQL